jgi:hypothetical protein
MLKYGVFASNFFVILDMYLDKDRTVCCKAFTVNVLINYILLN